MVSASIEDRSSVTVPLLQIQVEPMTAEETARWIVDQDNKALLANHNLHSAYLFHTDEAFREFCTAADRTVIDGAPILWLARQADRSLGSNHRIGSTDWIAALASIPVRSPARLLVYGSTAASNMRCVESLRETLGVSGWSVEGLDGFVPEQDAVRWIQGNRPTLVIVGLGMPRQEQFLLENWEVLPNAVYANVGGAIDYVGGTTKLAPRWVGSVGAEWLWRLVHSPRRLARRYLIEPFKLAYVIARSSAIKSRSAASNESPAIDKKRSDR